MTDACNICGGKEILPYKCKFCGGIFCSEHRLPEQHHCTGLEKLQTQVRGSGRVIYQPTSGPMKQHSTGLFNRSSRSPYAVPISRNYSLYIIMACVFIFFLQIFIHGFTQFFVFIPQLIIERPWTIISSLFLHGSFSHLFINMLVLFFFGPILERKLGSIKFLTIYFGAGLVAALGHMVVSPTPILGASGAIFGIFSCLALLEPELRVYVLFFPMKIIQALALFALIDIIGIGSNDMIAHDAHLFGLLFGLYMGYRLKKAKSNRIW